MPSLDESFQELRQRLRQPDTLSPARSDPFFYLVHEPGECLEVRRALIRWRSQLAQDGWAVEEVSLSKLLWDLIDASGRWQEWLELEEGADWHALNTAVRDVIETEDALIRKVEAVVGAERPGAVVLLTDAAMLHPYVRSRLLESRLHDKVKVPTILFYPGRRSGQYGLHFLGFYPVDGNYRASLIGGNA